MAASETVANDVDVNTTSFDMGLPTAKKNKVPKRVLHFSDGILEEYSSDESEDSEDITVKVDPSSLNWGPWCMFYLTGAARCTLSAADYFGERLAWFLGITTPKYQYAISEHNRIQKEIELETLKEKKLKEEMEGISSVDVQIVAGRKAKGKYEAPPQEDSAEKY